METNRLKQFCTIVETGNLRSAAEILGISHSGLFKSIKTLEAEVGFPLFIAQGRGVVVTDAGKKLYQRSPHFFQELARLTGQTEAPDQSLIRIGSFEVFTSYFVGRMLKKHFAQTQVEIHELLPGRLEEALILDRIDLGITYEPVPRPQIEYMKITRIVMGAYALRKNFEGKSISEIPFAVPVTPLEGTPSHVKGLDAWPENRFKRNAFYKVDLMTTGLELARQGLCAIFIPQFVAKMQNESAHPDLRLSALELPKGMPQICRDVYLVKRESTLESDHLKKVAKAIREFCV